MSGPEIFVIVIVALLLFGADKLPEIAKTFGKGMRDFKKATDDIRREIETSTTDIKREFNDTADSIKKEVTDISDNITKNVNDMTDDIKNEVNQVSDEIKTEVNEVTVFFEGAQITSKKTIELTTGKSILKFINLSPFIDPKSVQVKANGEITILSVNHQQNYLDKLEKSEELKALETKLENTEKKIILENAYLSVIREELAFLQDNRDIGGKNDQAIVVLKPLEKV